MTCGGNANAFEDTHERAFAESDLGPRNDAHDQGQSAEIEKSEIAQRATQGARNRFLGIGGFAGGDAHNFQSEIAEDGHHHAEADAAPTVW